MGSATDLGITAKVMAVEIALAAFGMIIIYTALYFIRDTDGASLSSLRRTLRKRSFSRVGRARYSRHYLLQFCS